MKEILLTQGMVALVSDCDYARVSCMNWYANKKRMGVYVAARGGGNRGGKIVYMHRLIMEAMEGFDVDHINGNCLDNRRENLRVCLHYQNTANRTRKNCNNRSGVTGVSWDNNCQKWVARIVCKYKVIQMGYFTNLSDAVLARKQAENHYFGAFAPIGGTR